MNRIQAVGSRQCPQQPDEPPKRPATHRRWSWVRQSLASILRLFSDRTSISCELYSHECRCMILRIAP